MRAIELTEAELKVVRAARHAWLDDFGHEEAHILRAIKAILAKLPTPAAERDILDRLADA